MLNYVLGFLLLFSAACGSSPTCTDGTKNGSETDVDCGGSCGPCAAGKACAAGSDCSTGSARAGLPGRRLHRRRQERQRDRRRLRRRLRARAPPASLRDRRRLPERRLHRAATASAASCTDGVKNGDETDVDCGGGLPHAAPTPRRAAPARDCTSARCAAAASARRRPARTSVKNGSETDVDCGGSCGPCAARQGVRDHERLRLVGVCMKACARPRAAPTA